MAGAGVTSITGNGMDVQRWTITNNTPEQAELNLINKVQSKYYDELNKSGDLIDELYGKATKENKDSVSAIIDQLRKERNKISDTRSIDVFEMLSRQKEFTQAGLFELSSITLFGLKFNNNMNPYRERIAEVYNSRLTETQKQSMHGRTIYETLNPRKIRVLGDMLPSDELRDTLGVIHHMANYKGKYALIDIWSSSCGPCIKAGDELRAMQARYAEKLTIIGINVDNCSRWIQASKAHNVNWTNLSDGLTQSAGFCANFDMSVIPYYILADPTGKIIKITSGYNEGSIEKLLAEMIK